MNAIRHDELPSFYFMQYEIVRSPSPPSPTGERARGEVARLIKTPRPDPLPAQSRAEGMFWRVRNLLLVPHFAFPPSAIIKRPPLSPTARRAGWVGCNFALNRIPADARIPVVTTILSPSPPSPTGERARGEVARLIKTPRPNPLPAQSRGEGNVFRTIIVPPEEVRAQFKRVKPLKDISVTQRGWTLDVLNGVRSIGKNEFKNSDAYTLVGQLEKMHPDNRHVKDKIRQQLQVLRDAKLLIHVGNGTWRLL